MVIDRYRESLLRLILTDHILIEKFLDLSGRAKVDVTVGILFLFVGELFIHDLRAHIYALVTDIDAARSGDQFANLVLCLIAK